ncbi:MAG: 16S rRNA (cytidine(1402)-2'-O)-methyltransferase [Candidatus Eisenbacteria bacterium]|nr:16S rRNA (cytidine(1402)-2'-O)-methyltransferase [Candidatus Eisenbacteria bacterium]
MTETKGKLYLVATPIGNMEDISIRALRTLRGAAFIAAEDTRHSRKLLARYKIRRSLLSYHDFNKAKVAPQIIKRIASGEDVALVSDAGSPGISDPGFLLVKLAIAEGIDVVPIPGASSVICALQISGLATHSFAFEGFLPRKKGKRRARLESLKPEERTMIFFESPNRLRTTVPEMLEVLGDRKIAICRELTKLFEEVIRTTLFRANELLAKRTIKGEVVLVVEGNAAAEARRASATPAE